MTSPDASYEIEALKVGTHTSAGGEVVGVATADLDALAAAYDPATWRAPVVIGHPEHEDPAWGWVDALERRGEVLVAKLGELEPQFLEAVRAGRYRNVSVSLYKPEAAANPRPGGWYLRHLGFLGAQPPAVKGLAPAQFADGGLDAIDTVELGEISPFSLADAFRGLRNWLLARFGAEAADEALPEGLVSSVQEQAARADAPAEVAGEAEPLPFAEQHEESDDVTMDPNAPHAAEVEALKAELAAREARLTERERAARRREDEAFLEGLVKEGRALPVEADRLVAFMARLRGDDSVELGEGTDLAAVFRDEVLAGLPKQVDFAERAPGGGDDPARGDDPVELSERARKYQAEQRAQGVEIPMWRAVQAVEHGGGE